MLGEIAVRFLPIPEFLSWLIVQYGVSNCLLQDNYISKFHELVPAAENKDPHRLHERFEQTSSEQTHNITLGPNLFFNDDFGRLAGSEPLFRGVRVAVMDQCFYTCDSFHDKSITLGIVDNLTTDIHSTIEVSIYEVPIHSFCMIF